MKKRLIVWYLIIACLMVFPTSVWAAEPLAEARELIKNDYVTAVDAKVLQMKTIKEMVAALDDPYSTYIEPDNLKEFLSSLDGEYVGVGMYIEQINKECQVTSPIPGSPAEKAGIQPGDVILKVNGISVAGLSSGEVAAKIRGPEGTRVSVTIRRATQVLTYQLLRQTIRISSVEYFMIGPSTGYVRLNGFNSDSPTAMKSALDQLTADGALTLVLDLRDNPGGLLDVAVSLAGEFIPKGPVVHVIQRGDDEYTLSSYKTPRGLPLAVLVNGNTASAGEILAGAIQDAATGKIVGVKTYGKGSVQTIFTLSNGGGLKMTIAKYLTPKRHEVNKIGISPDVLVTEEGQQLAAGVKTLGSDSELYDFLLSLDSPQYFAGSQIGRLPANPYLQGGSIMVPLRTVAGALGGKVTWQDGKTVVLSAKGKIVVDLHKRTITTNGIASGGQAVLRQGQLMVPLRLLTNSLGYKTIWYQDNHSVAVTQ